MLVIDAQVHLNKMHPAWREADADAVIAAALSAIGDLAIDAVLIDEDDGADERGRLGPARDLPGGARRYTYGFAERAVAARPDRFAYVAKVDPRDPELDDVVAEIARTPGQVALRVVPRDETGESALFEAGAYDGVFRAARRSGLPVFVWLPGRAHLLEPYARSFPDVRFIVDHCGVARPSANDRGPARFAGFGETLALARYENVSLKWGKAPLLSEEPYPYGDVKRALRRALEAFGRDRIMWASDHTEVAEHHTWGEALSYIRNAPELSALDKEWILGGTARTILSWPR